MPQSKTQWCMIFQSFIFRKSVLNQTELQYTGHKIINN